MSSAQDERIVMLPQADDIVSGDYIAIDNVDDNRGTRKFNFFNWIQNLWDGIRTAISDAINAIPTASQSEAGLMSAADKAKIDLIQDQATKNTPSSATPQMDGVGNAGTSGDYARGDHRHPTDTSRAPLDSPALTGTPTAPTAAAGTNTTQIATTGFVAQELQNAPHWALIEQDGNTYLGIVY